jgi:hypothetical protein
MVGNTDGADAADRSAGKSVPVAMLVTVLGKVWPPAKVRMPLLLLMEIGREVIEREVGPEAKARAT